jgi:hypothetical protein
MTISVKKGRPVTAGMITTDPSVTVVNKDWSSRR